MKTNHAILPESTQYSKHGNRKRLSRIQAEKTVCQSENRQREDALWQISG